ncbi:hypothetical protein AVEN_8113-1 [Araneus ventricosus]|uniref:Uncharacterized protein n=1 Tax=Araneus ventricosus TaxID=182803 RepID=A0A4Y2BJH9_ARAVE|nr:hypothetical protein AVEN_8113-1 [Araneus ventricosus]
MTRTTPEPAPHFPNLHATPTGTQMALVDLSAPDPLTRRFFRGIGNSEEQPPDSTAISFLTENENLMKQPPDATSSSDSDPDLSLSPRPQTYGLRPSGGSILRTLISPPTNHLKPGDFGSKRHELDSPNLGGHLLHHPIPCYNLPKGVGKWPVVGKENWIPYRAYLLSDLRTSSPSKEENRLRPPLLL